MEDMKTWVVKLKTSAYKQFTKLPISVKALLDCAIDDMHNQEPIPQHWDVKKIEKNEYRLRLNYRYRMRYRVMFDYLIIEVFYIGHRKDAY